MHRARQQKHRCTQNMPKSYLLFTACRCAEIRAVECPPILVTVTDFLSHHLQVTTKCLLSLPGGDRPCNTYLSAGLPTTCGAKQHQPGVLRPACMRGTVGPTRKEERHGECSLLHVCTADPTDDQDPVHGAGCHLVPDACVLGSRRSNGTLSRMVYFNGRKRTCPSTVAWAKPRQLPAVPPSLGLAVHPLLLVHHFLSAVFAY
jgi:hypothetical protein